MRTRDAIEGDTERLAAGKPCSSYERGLEVVD